MNVPEGASSVDASKVEDAVRQTLIQEGVGEAEVSLTFLDDPEIREMNARYLRRDYVTDVISFHLHDPPDPPLGDVYIGVDQALRQAAEEGIDADEELVRLAIHGTLHVLGYEHPDGAERVHSDMFRRQEAVVAQVMRRKEGSDGT